MGGEREKTGGGTEGRGGWKRGRGGEGEMRKRGGG